ncbi:hypothetical protein AwWohl_00700 [Gammaproteobacteria bacterium]|nr:hypothetical protein AwWohl_00700 [Gammaproteobacteria bacterium]
MRLLTHHDLDTHRVRSQFTKLQKAIARDDFKSPNLKKLNPTLYWRFKLDQTHRLLVQFVTYNNITVCLALEVILNHDYAKSRFLRGAQLQWDKIDIDDDSADTENLSSDTLRYIHPKHNEFHILDKVLSFDDAQEAVYNTPAPLILVGSAGSGKTALTLQKLRQARGNVLYVTQSAFLAQSAQTMYFSYHYEDEDQEPVFLSYREFIETLQIPKGRELGFGEFSGWFSRHKQSVKKLLSELDAHALFEEFRGVISSSATGILSRKDYANLGVRQSLLASEQRMAVYDLFEKYRTWLAAENLFDITLVTHEWQDKAIPSYDFIVVDEVQDLTSVQLALVLKTLNKAGQFLLCGDSNQIVHPNFFSWSSVKTLLWQDKAQSQQVSVLRANFRNGKAVTELANTLLKIKHARFGSVDKETNFLVEASSNQTGSVQLLADKEATRKELNTKTRNSMHFAIIVLRDEDKAAARIQFQTPLVFSVHEAKGLEYPNVILVDIISGQRAKFLEISTGVNPDDLLCDQLDYSRARDKTDKSLEIYKFYINALYVALTRAVDNLLIVERDFNHPLLNLLNLQTSEAMITQAKASSQQEWAQEARRLELQGKQEQADAIRKNVLKIAKPSWPVWDEAAICNILPIALAEGQISNKPRQILFDYAVWHGQTEWIFDLMRNNKFTPAIEILKPDSYVRVDYDHAHDALQVQFTNLCQRHGKPYAAHNFKEILHQCDQFGVEHRTLFNATPLMMAGFCGNIALIKALIERGASIHTRDHYGHCAWDYALVRYFHDDSIYNNEKYRIDILYQLLSPPFIDLQVNGRLVRLERHQGEYSYFNLMLIQSKRRFSFLLNNPDNLKLLLKGYSAGYLEDFISLLPDDVVAFNRRKRSYINHILARAEKSSNYSPSRQLWVRVKTGYYILNKDILLREHSDAPWIKLEEWINQSFIYSSNNVS